MSLFLLLDSALASDAPTALSLLLEMGEHPLSDPVIEEFTKAVD